jgi:chorismate-pyruvate lyase
VKVQFPATHSDGAPPTGGAVPAYPLDEFYARSGLTLPPLEVVHGAAVPEPYRTLLVHESDMTSTLEAFHKAKIQLRPVSRDHHGNDYSREVVLTLEGSGRPVEFGAIRIFLDRFPAAARQEILNAQRPLGYILRDSGLHYVSRPKAFLKLASDRTINELLGLTGAHLLYGRRNSLLDPSGRPLAEIVEILPDTHGGYRKNA